MIQQIDYKEKTKSFAVLFKNGECLHIYTREGLEDLKEEYNFKEKGK